MNYPVNWHRQPGASDTRDSGQAFCRLTLRAGFVFFLLVLFFLDLCAQNRNRNWVFSDSIGLRFNQDGTITQFIANVCGLQRHGCATLSDANGRLQYYAGGSGAYILPSYNPNYLRIFRRDNSLMTNYPGVTKNNQIYTLQGFLEFGQECNSIAFVHMEHDSDSGRNALLCLSQVDRYEENGMGAFTFKKRIVVNGSNDTLVQGFFPVRHANGRDWWIISHIWGTDTFIVVLVDSELKYKTSYQKIGSAHGIDGKYYVGGNLPIFHFIKSKNELIVHNSEGLLEKFSFDRCSGDLTNHKLIIPAFSMHSIWGESLTYGTISQSTQYLYIAAYNHIDTMVNILQFDLWASDIASSREVLYYTDANKGGSFSQLGLAPDGKIYVNCWGDTTDTSNVNQPNKYYLSVIENPDLPYPMCNFIPRGLWLNGRLASSGIPDFINYDLGPVDGSACDTLGLDAAVVGDSEYPTFPVFPNPTSGTLTVGMQEEEFMLYNLQGRKMENLRSDANGQIHLPPTIPDGLYLLLYFPNETPGAYRCAKIQVNRE